MGKNPVITIIGAASTTFGPKVLRDILNHPEVAGCTFRFVDTNGERLEIYTRLAGRVSAALPFPVTVWSTTDRREALPDSDCVIVSVDTGHYTTWKKDFDIPISHGIRQVLGELGGPGGLFHSLRQIPLHLAIAKDIEELCPNAMVMVSSNPLNRICLALERHAKVGQVVGLCHGVEMASHLFLNNALGIDGYDMQITAFGINHFTWIMDLRRISTGDDLYPLVRKTLTELEPRQQPLSTRLMEVYGYLPGTLDDHFGEYVPYAYEYCGLDGMDFSGHLDQENKRWEYMRSLADNAVQWDTYERHYGDQEIASEELRLDDFFSPRSWADTLAFPLISAMISNKMHRMVAVNLLNRGAIANLPEGIFVETPGVVDSAGVRAENNGPLPAPLAAFLRRDVDQMEMTVEAAVTGDRRILLQAMLLDPVVDSISGAEKTLDELLIAHAEYLPQF